MKALTKTIALIFVLLVACESNQPVKISSLESIDFNNIPISADYEIAKLIPLETKNENLMSNWLRVKEKDSLFYILDENIKDAIFTFDSKGVFLKNIVSVGDGPNKLQAISDFTIYQDTLFVLSVIGTTSKINAFDLEGKLLNVLELEMIIDSFERIDKDTWAFYLGYNYPLSKYRLIYYNIRDGNMERFFKNDFDEPKLPMEERNFYPENASTLLKESFNNIIYQVDKSGPNELISFDFGKYKIPENFWEMDQMEAFEQINEKGFANIYNVFANERYLVSEVYVQSIEGVKNHQVILDKKENQLSKHIFNFEDNHPYYNIVGLNNDNQLIVAARPNDLIAFKNKVKYKDSALSKTIANLEEDDNPVLVYLSLP